MTKQSFIALAALAFAPALFAQQGGNPLTQGTKALYQMMSDNVLKSAEEMPEENYSFKPVDTVRSFGQILGHIADAQYGFCGTASGDHTKSPGIEKNKTSKADIVQGLKDAFAFCNKALDSMTDAQGQELVPFYGGRKMPKLIVLELNNMHLDEHYGNLVTYLRIKGLVPPSSQH